MKGIILFFTISILFNFSISAQITEYSPGQQTPSGKFEAYEIDSNSVARLYYDSVRVKCEGKVLIRNKLFGKSVIKEHGVWLFYDKNSKIEVIGSYYKGRKHGIWIYFNEKKDVEKIIMYQKGKEIEIKRI